MSSYRVVTGDTFETIARKVYGTELAANQLAKANPGVLEPLTAGIEVIVPVLPGTPADLPATAPANGPDEVAISIGNKRFRFWDSVAITRSIDQPDSVEMGAPFEPDTPGFRETFRPFTFRPMGITVGGAPLFTGTAVSVAPVLTDTERTVFVGGYALPGALNDCNAPASAYPLEFNGQTLEAIATTLAAPFGVAVEFQASAGTPFDRVAIEPTTTVAAFLADLAKQRNLIMSSTPRGALLFWQSVDVGNPVARLRQGGFPVVSVLPSFNAQEYFSHITGVEPVAVGLPGAQFTVKNSRLSGVVRPLTFSVKDAEGGDVKAAVEAKMGRMFGNAAAYPVEVVGWRDSFGELWAPNTTLTLLAPGAMIYNEFEFIIRSVTLHAIAKSRTAVLDLVIPGAFSGKVPEVLPWDG